MAEPSITEIDVASWLRKARKQPDPVAWLEQLSDQATTAVAAHDEYVTMMADESGSSNSERKIDARFLQHVTEHCLQRLEAESAAGGADNLPKSKSVRYGDFQ